MKKVLFLISMIGLILIVSVIVGCILFATFAAFSDAIHPHGCSPIPEDFSEAELIGTWMGGWPEHSDILIIKPDKTYKQIIHIEFPERSPIDYESGWQSWRLEYSADQIAYLHLDGYRFCGMNPEIPCEERIGGGYDFCRDETIKMNNEGILLVMTIRDNQLSRTEDPGKKIFLVYPLGSESSWSYHLQRPPE